MSPLSLRRYRAERLLRQEFERLRGAVFTAVSARLRGSGVTLDQADLESCYAQAWQGLFTTMLAGEEIANPAGWLVLVTFRRAIEEHRASVRRARLRALAQPRCDRRAHQPPEREAVQERDFASELDDRARLRQLLEGLRARLSAREREAVALCYLQGLSRAEAAARMGISESSMRKLMDGRGRGRPGAARKMGRVVEKIRAGEWCEEQGSLMRGLAYGVLDPQGERYRLALLHRSECPACRAYVLSLRGLAAALPPALAPASLGAAALALAGGGSQTALHATAGAAAGSSAGSGALASAGGGVVAGGAATAGAASTGLQVLGAKLAVGCLIALGVGAGCVALVPAGPGPFTSAGRRHDARHRRRLGPAIVSPAPYTWPASATGTLAAVRPLPAAGVHVRAAASSGAGTGAAAGASAATAGASRAAGEFGPERQATALSAAPATEAGARAASTGAAAPLERVATGSTAGQPPSPPAAPTSSQPSPQTASAAEREFAPR